ncbi:MAG: hypothetical protein ACXVCT_10240 [Ktedonobacterales bacterium]
MRSMYSTRNSHRHISILFSTLLLTLVLALAGCATNGTTDSNQPNGSSGPGKSSAITLSGAVTGTISSVGTCAPASSDLFKPVWTATIGGKLYLFQLVLTHYKGAGSYTTDQTEGSPAIDLTSESDGAGWHSQYSTQSSTITLSGDLLSGTVDGILTQDGASPASTVHVSGSWVCANS